MQLTAEYMLPYRLSPTLYATASHSHPWTRHHVRRLASTMPSFRLCPLRGKACLSALGNQIFCQSAPPAAILFFRQASTTQPDGRVQNEPRGRVGSTLTGETGRQYVVESILKDNDAGRPVYLATYARVCDAQLPNHIAC